jgi:HAD superfamily hydrolase (TIGR01490 family)
MNPQTAPLRLALFDLDNTLIPFDSDATWGEFTTDLGWNDGAVFRARNAAFYDDYKAGTLDIHAYVRFATAALRAKGPEVAQATHRRFMQDVVLPRLYPQARALVAGHQAQGDTVIIITATNAFVTRPIAEAFGVTELIATDLAVDTAATGGSGWISGEIAGTPAFREGKVTRLEAWLAARSLDWGQVHKTFYSDSINDLPLLEKADVAVAANPDPRLRAIAEARGWRILELFAGV